MGARNYNYQIPREGSHIHGSRCNTWKNWETISQNKHCCHFWWLRPTVWKSEQQHKSDSSGSTLYISHFQKRSRARSSTKVKIPLMKSIAEVHFKKGSSMLHYKESFLGESYTTVNFLQTSFLTLSGRVARTAFHENHQFFREARLALHDLKYIFCGKWTGNTEIFLMGAK